MGHVEAPSSGGLQIVLLSYSVILPDKLGPAILEGQANVSLVSTNFQIWGWLLHQESMLGGSGFLYILFKWQKCMSSAYIVQTVL